MKDVFITTENFDRFTELVDELLSSSLGVEMAAVLAPYGRGKSKAAERIVSFNPKVCCVTYEPRLSIAGLIREMAFQVAGVRPSRSQMAVEAIQDELSRERRCIIVDEADQMTTKHLNQLRSFHDLHHVPIILMGEEALHRKLAREGRLISRVRAELRFKPLGQAEVVAFYRKSMEMSVTPEQSTKLLRHSNGDFRRLIVDAVHLARYMKVNGLREITDKLVDALAEGQK